MSDPKFTEARDNAIIDATLTGSWQGYYEFAVEHDIPRTIGCPKDRMAMVMMAGAILLQRAGKLKEAGVVALNLTKRGYVVNEDRRSLTNTKKEDKPVFRIPDELRLFDEGEKVDGPATSGSDETGTGVDAPSGSPVDPVQSDQGGIRVTRGPGTSVPVRRGTRKANGPNRIP